MYPLELNPIQYYNGKHKLYSLDYCLNYTVTDWYDNSLLYIITMVKVCKS